jgi:hypothetical protein
LQLIRRKSLIRRLLQLIRVLGILGAIRRKKVGSVLFGVSRDKFKNEWFGPYFCLSLAGAANRNGEMANSALQLGTLAIALGLLSRWDISRSISFTTRRARATFFDSAFSQAATFTRIWQGHSLSYLRTVRNNHENRFKPSKSRS